MKQYNEPKLELLLMLSSDVLTNSPNDPNGGLGDILVSDPGGLFDE